MRTKPIKSGIAAFAIIAGAVAGSASPAGAGAYGCSTWGSGTYRNVPYAKGYYCAEINGSKTYVKYVGGGFSSAGNQCNWNITAEFFDTAGRWYRTFNGPVHYRCDTRANDVIWIDRSVQRGTMCSTFKAGGIRRTSVCHSIY